MLNALADPHTASGGSRVLPDAMTKYINQQAPGALQLNKEVTGIKEVGPGQLQVQVLGEDQPRTYKHVICTLPLPVLRTLDIDNAGLNVKQTNALRQLQYGPACKIGVKFKSAWWTDKLDIVGGQSYGDRCIRTTVYPSYGLDEDKTTVLIASYTWTHDALRWSALINPPPEQAERASARLKELVLRDLARVHNVEYGTLVNEYKEHFAWDWTNDPLTQGTRAYCLATLDHTDSCLQGLSPSSVPESSPLCTKSFAVQLLTAIFTLPGRR